MKKKRTIQQVDYIYGINPLIEVLKAKKRKVRKILTLKQRPKRWGEIQTLLPKYPVEIISKSRAELTTLSGTSDHQGVVAVVQPFSYRTKSFSSEKYPFLLMLDGIQDVRNLGAILRSAYCTGVDGIILSTKNSALVTATTFKASAGYVEHMSIYLSSSLSSTAQELRSIGYTLYLAGFGGTDALSVSYTRPVCLVIGAEGKGISQQLFSYGTTVTLPQRSKEVSYNASVAAALLLFIASYYKD
jgi:23S rRNA (guanosine2251-2'-O)-methyltransferase